MASGQGNEPSSQASNPCCRAMREIVWLHNTQLDLPRLRLRSVGQVMPEKVQMVSLAPVGVKAKWVVDVVVGVPGNGTEMAGVVDEVAPGVGVLEEGRGLFAEEDMMKGERKRKRNENTNIGQEVKRTENEFYKTKVVRRVLQDKGYGTRNTMETRKIR